MQGHPYRNGQYYPSTPAAHQCGAAEDARSLHWIDNEWVGLVVVFAISLILWGIPAGILFYFVG